MNYTFRTKPVVIEAFQMTKGHIESNVDWPSWLIEARLKSSGTVGSLHWFDVPSNPEAKRCYALTTLEGELIVSPNDFIIQGVDGTLSVCKPGTFYTTYEEDVDEDVEEHRETRDTVTIALNEEYFACEWWASIRKYCLERVHVPDVTVVDNDDVEHISLRVWIREHGTSCDMARSDLDTVLNWFATFPGWSDGPDHAPNPVVVAL